MNHSESKLQASIIQEFQRRGIYAFSVPNEGALSGRRQMFLKSLGLRNGVSDLIIVLPSRIIFMEVKTPTGTQSENQKAFQQQVESLGHTYVLVRSVDDALAAVGVGG
jgi:hypothetical protein